MRIKSADNAGHAHAYLSRDPKDPLPNPHEGTRYRNGRTKESELIADEKLDSRGVIPEENNNNIESHFVNGQNHIIYPTVSRNVHEMAVRTKVISVKRDIQPSTSSYRQKPSVTQQDSSNGSVPAKPNGRVTPKMEPQPKFQFNNVPPKSPRTPNGVSPSAFFSTPSTPSVPSTPSAAGTPQTPTVRTPPTPYSPQTPFTPTTPRDTFGAFDVPGSRHSSSSSSTLPYPVSPALRSPNYFNASPTRLTRQMSSYERNSASADLDRLSAELAQTNVSNAPKFIKDTSAFWYKPDITRDQALAILQDKPPGSFVIRDSRCFPGAFGLALKVDRLPPAVQAKPGVDMSNEYVRHFLIEMSSKGVKLKGCPNEPIFGSLSALVYQHSITPLALPCKLIIPDADQEVPEEVQNGQSDAVAAAELLKQGAACNVIYIGSLDMESLTGPKAIENAITKTCAAAKAKPNKTSVVHFKVSPQGITLTDLHRKVFFRRHYPTTSVTFCDLDPQGSNAKDRQGRRWDATSAKGSPDAWMFGFVARKISGSNDNECHIFAELEPAQPARAIVNFVTRILIGTHRQGVSP